MDKNVIKVEQLPIIAERLHEIKAEIEKEAKALMELECTDETLTFVKAKRADFNKVAKEYEEKRKEVKNAILEPYNAFEEVYKECITVPVKKALEEVDGKIKEITDKRVDGKVLFAKGFYSSLAVKFGLMWLEFERLGIKVNASDTEAKIKSAVSEKVDKILDDLKLIATHEYPDEILYEYKRSLNAINAIVNVMERHKALDKVEKAEANSAVPAEPAMTEDDILDAGMADMEVPKMVVFEKPKKEFKFKIYLDEDEYAEFLKVIGKFEYEEVK